jgi:4-amino-4-deoxy-L-arabinose transferase-like glycosyltransferase
MLLALAAVFLWRFLFSTYVNLIPDECSYWAWSRRLDWSYFDNSGMVAYLIRASTELFGASTPFTVRFPFLLLSALSTYLVYDVSRVLFGNGKAALFAALAFNLTPLALLGGSAAVHDNALLFFWVATLWAAARFVQSERPAWFYVMGITCGLAMLSKYTGVLLLGCLLVFLLWSGPHRKVLRTKEPWIAALLACAFTFPIIWWNIHHGWASLYHILYIGSGAVSPNRRFLDGLGYHAAQILLVSPLLFYAMLLSVIAAVRRNLLRTNPAEVLLLSFGTPLVVFGILAFRGHVEANWAFMGYISVVILCIQVIVRGKEEDDKRFRGRYGQQFIKWGVIAAVAPVALVVAHAWVGLLPASLERNFAKDDRVIWETRGGKALGEHVGREAHDDDVIAADTYQLCALLEFNVPGQPKVRYLSPWNRPTQFDVWEPSFDNLAGRNVLFVSAKTLEPSSAVRTTIYEHFAKVEPVPPFGVMYHGEPIREIHLYRGIKFNPFAPRRLPPRSLFYKTE